jgi:hypothetical protein
MGDFLHKNASTPCAETYLAAGAICRLSTNSPAILSAARESFFLIPDHPPQPDFSMRLWVDDESKSSLPWPKPYLRGLDHLVYAGFASGSSAVINLLSRRIAGRFSPQFASDTAYWNSVVLPMLLSVIAGSAGTVELHCSCVAKQGSGVLLAGPSSSGKSTLAVALASLGFGFLSDDRTFCSWRHNDLSAWGLLTELKLRSEASAWFSDLSGQSRAETGRGEIGFRLPPESLPFLRRVRHCEPRWLVFLDRQPSNGFHLTSLAKPEAERRLQQDLMAELPDAVQQQSAVISRLVDLPCSVLRYGGNPWTIAGELASHFDEIANLKDRLQVPVERIPRKQSQYWLED